VSACTRCNREMLAAPSCDPDPDVRPYGEEGFTWEIQDRCNDCNVIKGGFHHRLCDLAACEHGQRLVCRRHDDDWFPVS